MFKLILPTAALALFLTSCGKNKTVENPTPSKGPVANEPSDASSIEESRKSILTEIRVELADALKSTVRKYYYDEEGIATIQESFMTLANQVKSKKAKSSEELKSFYSSELQKTLAVVSKVQKKYPSHD